MALTAAEEALVRELIAENPELLSLAANEATIISKLGATKKNLSELAAALSLSDTDLAFVRQGSTDKSVALSVMRAFMATGVDLSGYLQKSGGSMTGLLKFAAGANIASAANVNLAAATGNTVHITGTTGINAWTMAAGQLQQVIFDGVLTLTHNAATNNLPGAANIITAAGDRAMLYYDGTKTYVFAYQRADGTALVSSGGNQKMSLTAAVSTNTGTTTIDLTSIPSWAKKITISFDNVSLSGSAICGIQLGTSGGVEATGYSGAVTGLTTGAASTSHSTNFTIDTAGAAATGKTGNIVLSLLSGNQWTIGGALGTTGSSRTSTVGGAKTLSGTLDRIRLMNSGADTFDGGSVSLLIEGY